MVRNNFRADRRDFLRFIKNSALAATFSLGLPQLAKASESYDVIPQDGYFSLQFNGEEFMRIHGGYPVVIQPNPSRKPSSFGSEVYVGPMPLNPQKGSEISSDFYVEPSVSLESDRISVSLEGLIPGEDLVTPVGSWFINSDFVYSFSQGFNLVSSSSARYITQFAQNFPLILSSIGSYLNPNSDSLNDVGDTWLVSARGGVDTNPISWYPLRDRITEFYPYPNLQISDAGLETGLGEFNGVTKPAIGVRMIKDNTPPYFFIEGGWDPNILDSSIKNLNIKIIQQGGKENINSSLEILSLNVI